MNRRRRWVRRIVLAFALVTGAVAAMACHPPPTLVTPQGQAAYTADQIVNRVGEFQQAVIDASDAGKLPVQDARTIVSWCVWTVHALRQSPSGWQRVAMSSWDQVRVVVSRNGTLAPWVPIIDALLQGGL